MHGDAVQVEGVVVEPLPNRTFWVELANGHRPRAFLSRRWRVDSPSIAAGDRIRVAVSPYDMSRGLVVTAGK